MPPSSSIVPPEGRKSRRPRRRTGWGGHIAGFRANIHLGPAGDAGRGVPARRAAGLAETIGIATGSPGGAHFAYGEALARLLNRTLGIRVITQPTSGPSANITLLAKGEAELGVVTPGVAAQAWDGAAPWTDGEERRDFRAAFPMCGTPFHFIVRKVSPAQKLSDLAGMRIGVGPEGDTGAIHGPALLKTLGIEGRFAAGT